MKKIDLKNLDLRREMKKLAGSQFVGNLSKQLSAYEGKVKRMVGDFDLKSREARAKGQKQLDKVAGQFQKTRQELEKRVTTLFHQEGKRLNEGVNELVNYLKRVAKNEKLEMKAVAKRKPSKGGENASSRKRKRTRKA